MEVLLSIVWLFIFLGIIVWIIGVTSQTTKSIGKTTKAIGKWADEKLKDE